MLKIYGSPRSSAGRCYLVMEELNLKYENVPLDMGKKEHKSPEYLKLNPNGKVPCLVDGDFVIWESLAINYYLAQKHKPELLGENPQEMGLVQQWSTWGLVEMQPPLVQMLIQLMFIPEDKRDMGVVASAKEKVPPMLKILDNALKDKKYLVSNKITLADFNVGSVVNLAMGLKVDLQPFTNITSWMNHLRERPSFKKFIEARSH